MVIEENVPPPIAITIDSSVNVHGSQNVQVGGSGNVMNVKMDFEKMINAVDQAQVSEPQKAEAKSLLRQLAENDLVQWIIKKCMTGG